jgi:hypothetical protein
MNWKSISEVPPRNLIGESIFVFDDHSKWGGGSEVKMGYCWRGNLDGSFNPDGEVVLWDLCEDEKYVNITHWMPMPEPPEKD